MSPDKTFLSSSLQGTDPGINEQYLYWVYVFDYFCTLMKHCSFELWTGSLDLPCNSYNLRGQIEPELSRLGCGMYREEESKIFYNWLF